MSGPAYAQLRSFSLAICLVFGALSPLRADVTILNASYDPTREFYKEFDAAFAAKWLADTGEAVNILSSHGGSGKQARAVIDGLPADVVTLALESDINAIASKAKLIAPDWRGRLPNNSAPYTSTIVFLVRAGNPKAIHDWGDLVKDEVEVITPNPKTSGGARWNYLAAWAWAHDKFGGDETKIKQFVGDLYRHVPVLDTGARGATTTFVQREIGDVLLTWENEAFLALEDFGAGQFEIIVPPQSILAEPPVAVVDANVDAHDTRKVSEAYLSYLYSETGQKLILKHHYRPAKPELVSASELAKLPQLKLVSIDDPMFGGWEKTQSYHFAKDGIFDQIYKPGQ